MCASDAQRSSSDPRETAEQHFRRATELYNKEDLEGSIAELRAALLLNPNDAAAHYNLGQSLRRKGESNATIAEFRAALRLGPNDFGAHYNLGRESPTS